MDQRGYFYSYVDPVWSLQNIGTSCHVIETNCISGKALCTKETLLDFR